MVHPISYILRQAYARKKYNILCFATHEGYQTNLSKTGHNFIMCKVPNSKEWDFHTRPLPPNHYIYPISDPSPKFNFEIDLILSQERFNQLPMALELQRVCGAPVIHLEHTEPHTSLNQKKLEKVIQVRANKHVYITEHNKNSWQDTNGTVILHGIDDNIFNNWIGGENSGASVVNLFPQRDIFCGWNLWQQITSKANTTLYGYNPGLSESIPSDVLLAEKLRKHAYFLNTSLLSPIPLSLLEAACIGMPIVSTAYQEVPKIFTHNKNALLANDTKTLTEYCQFFLNNPEVARNFGQQARILMQEKFSITSFVNNWNNVFDEVVNAN